VRNVGDNRYKTAVRIIPIVGGGVGQRLMIRAPSASSYLPGSELEPSLRGDWYGAIAARDGSVQIDLATSSRLHAGSQHPAVVSERNGHDLPAQLAVRARSVLNDALSRAAARDYSSRNG